mgnify:CR=1 FL=1
MERRLAEEQRAEDLEEQHRRRRRVERRHPKLAVLDAVDEVAWRRAAALAALDGGAVRGIRIIEATD